MEMPPDTLEAVGFNELFVAVTVDASSPSQICDDCALLRARKLDMEMPPDSLEDFLTKAARVSAPWCAPTSSLSFSICPSRPR